MKEHKGPGCTLIKNFSTLAASMTSHVGIENRKNFDFDWAKIK